jgi:hypothetical protein
VGVLSGKLSAWRSDPPRSGAVEHALGDCSVLLTFESIQAARRVCRTTGCRRRAYDGTAGLIQRWRLPRPVRRTQCRHPGEWTDHSHLGFSPVNLDAQNTYYGLYANETFNVTDRLSLTASGRLQPRQDRHGGCARHQPRYQRQLHLHELLAARGAGSPVKFIVSLMPEAGLSLSTSRHAGMPVRDWHRSFVWDS